MCLCNLIIKKFIFYVIIKNLMWLLFNVSKFV